MSNKGLLGKLVRKSNALFTASALALGSVYGCGGSGGIVEPTPKPTADFNVNPREGYAPLASCFNGSSSKAPESSISKFIWRFENGVVDSTSGVNVCHTYQNPGNYSAGLTVENSKGERSSQHLEQIVAMDPSPTSNIQSFNFNEDGTYALDLTGKVTSPIHNADRLRVTAASPDLIVTMNGLQANVTNKTKDWNGSTYVDWVVEDPDGRKTNSRTNSIVVVPQTDVKGYLENVLTGQRVQNVPVAYLTSDTTSNINGDFDFQIANGNDTLRINSNQFYNIKIPINANGQDVNLSNVQLIDRYTDPITGEDPLSFMNKYMREERWDDADIPIKVFIDNNPPSPEYREAVRKGIMELWQPVVNQWLPEGRKITLAEIVPSDPVRGIRVDYTVNIKPWFGFISFENIFKKGVLGMNSNQGVMGVPQTATHEFGHSFGFSHSPYSNHVMCEACPALPSPFEGLVVATKYKLKKGSVELYSK